MTFAHIAVMVALTKMFDKRSFLNICELETMWKLLEITPDSNTYNALRLMHCVHWKDVSEEIRTETAMVVAGTFGWSPNHINTNKLLHTNSL